MRLLGYLYIISHPHSLVQGGSEGRRVGQLIFQNFWISMYLGPGDVPECQIKSPGIKMQTLAVGRCLEATDTVRPWGSASVSLRLAPYFQMGKPSWKEVKSTRPWATVPHVFEVQGCDLESIVPGQEDNWAENTDDHFLLFPWRSGWQCLSGSTPVIFFITSSDF